MFFRKEESALQKWPRERPLKGGRHGFKITGLYCPPECAQLAEGLVWVTGALIMYLSGYIAAYKVPDAYEHYYFWPMMIGGLMVNYWLYKAGFHRTFLAFLFGPKLHIVVEPDRIRIGGLFGYKNYPRNELVVPIEVGTHKHAAKEQEKFRKGILPRKNTPYYCNTRQVIMRYGEKRIVLASIYDNQEKAEGLALRIMATQEVLDRGFGV